MRRPLVFSPSFIDVALACDLGRLQHGAIAAAVHSHRASFYGELLVIGPRAQRFEHDAAVQDLRNKIAARVRFLQRTLSIPAPVPLNFGSNGLVHITDWRVQNSKGIAQVEKISEGGKTLLHINTLADTNCVASWRSRVLLRPGEYRFQVRARTAAVIPIKDKKGEGAGVRISQFSKPRVNELSGDADWTQLEFDFPVVPGGTGEVDLLCELRARKGEVWFDLNSLSLIKK